MTDKKPFAEPTIATAVDLDVADRGFPLMALAITSGGGGDVPDGTDGTNAADGIN